MDEPARIVSPASSACQPASTCETFCGVMREEYSERKLLFGMALRPQNSPRPSSATSAMTWLLRSIDHSLSASAARRACAAGIICDPGSLAFPASASQCRRTRSGSNRNRPPTLVVNSRGLRMKSRTSATASFVGPTERGRSSSSRRGKRAKPSSISIARTAVAPRGIPCSLSVRLMS